MPDPENPNGIFASPNQSTPPEGKPVLFSHRKPAKLIPDDPEYPGFKLNRFQRESNRIIDIYEKGYAKWPWKLGGETKYGIAKRWHPEAWVDGPPTREKAVNIYHADYWVPLRGDEISEAAAPVLFDFAIHSGTSDAVKALQRAVGSPKITGKMDDDTVRRANEMDQALLVKKVMKLRRAHVEPVYGNSPELRRGFEVRFGQVENYALGLAQGAGGRRTSPSLFTPAPRGVDPDVQAQATADQSAWQAASEKLDQTISEWEKKISEL